MKVVNRFESQQKYGEGKSVNEFNDEVQNLFTETSEKILEFKGKG